MTKISNRDVEIAYLQDMGLPKLMAARYVDYFDLSDLNSLREVKKQ